MDFKVEQSIVKAVNDEAKPNKASFEGMSVSLCPERSGI